MISFQYLTPVNSSNSIQTLGTSQYFPWVLTLWNLWHFIFYIAQVFFNLICIQHWASAHSLLSQKQWNIILLHDTFIISHGDDLLRRDYKRYYFVDCITFCTALRFIRGIVIFLLFEGPKFVRSIERIRKR